jgi:predicted RNase H-like nuclease
MIRLLVGFDSAWTAGNSGGLVGVLHTDTDGLLELGLPIATTFEQAELQITRWQAELGPDETIILIDQPTIVENVTGQRPVENLVSSPVSRRYGGMQPANTGRKGMFDADAPIWGFLHRFGGPLDPFCSGKLHSGVIETYPVLTIIAMGWILESTRPTGRLPKYNPAHRKKFYQGVWARLCGQAAGEFRLAALSGIAAWLDDMSKVIKPNKSDQDGLDACLCLLVGIIFSTGKPCLVVGAKESGVIIVPDEPLLRNELEVRCDQTGRNPKAWVRVV